MSLNALWFRRQSTKFNGVAYIVQRARPPRLHARGHAQQVRALIDFYMENARDHPRGPGSDRPHRLRRPERAVHLGEDAGRARLVGLLRQLLNEAHVVGTPGAGFGPGGEGYLRLTAFGRRDQTEEAVERIKTRLAG